MNLCFDECLPPKLFRILAQILMSKKSPVSASHLLDHFSQGLTDDKVSDWLSEQSPPALLISADSGKQSGNNPRLPVLCPQRGITSIFIARKLCQVEGFEKLRMIMVCFPMIEAAYSNQRGVRYRLRRSGVHSYEIVPWRLITSSGAPRVPSSLFHDDESSTAS